MKKEKFIHTDNYNLLYLFDYMCTQIGKEFFHLNYGPCVLVRCDETNHVMEFETSHECKINFYTDAYGRKVVPYNYGYVLLYDDVPCLFRAPAGFDNWRSVVSDRKFGGDYYYISKSKVIVCTTDNYKDYDDERYVNDNYFFTHQDAYTKLLNQNS